MAWKTIGLAVATGTLVALVGSLVTKPLLRLDRTDDIAVRLHVLERHQPTMVFLGSSLFHAGIKPTELAQALGLQPEQVLNLAGPSMSVWHADAIVQNANASWDQVTVVLELDPWYLNGNQWHPLLHEPRRPDETFERWAPWRHRVAVDDLSSALAATALPVLRLRRPLVAWARLAAGTGPDWPDTVPLPGYHLDEDELERRKADERFAPREISTWHMRDYQHSPGRLERLEGLIADLRSRGAQPILVMMPLHPTYYDYVHADPQRDAEYATSAAAIEQLAETVPLIRYDDPASAGLTSADYVDYGHLNAQGGARFSRRLATDLAATGLLPSR